MAVFYKSVAFKLILLTVAFYPSLCQDLAIPYPDVCPPQPSTLLVQYFDVMRMRCLPCTDPDATVDNDITGEWHSGVE